nr:12487_t:CDS:2 [Entrophospora candida]
MPGDSSPRNLRKFVNLNGQNSVGSAGDLRACLSFKASSQPGTSPIKRRMTFESNGPTLTLNNEPPMTREDPIVIVEQYGQLNTKWAEWIHRNLFFYFFCRSWHAFFHSFYFTRIVNYAFYDSIPNLGYISEAATSPLVHQLQLNIVPKTEVVWLSSPSFHYDYSMCHSNTSTSYIERGQIKTTITTTNINTTCRSSGRLSKIVYPHIHVAAIDNGLPFPFKHPDQWRFCPYDANEMFSKQVTVLKEQGYNIAEILKKHDKGPLALCASHNLMVWNMIESIEVPEEPDHMESGNDNNNYQSNNIEIDGARNSLQSLDYGEAPSSCLSTFW